MGRLSLDKEFEKAIQVVLSKIQVPPKPEVGDIATRRKNIDGLMTDLMAKLPPATNVDKALIGHAQSHDGYEVAIYRFKKNVPYGAPGPAIVYCHGGGYFCLSVEIYQPLLQYYVSETGVTIYAMEYRLPPEHPFPSPVEDCFAALKFVHTNAAGLDVDPLRIILMGDSAGGGLCAGTAILARDRGLHVIAKQIVIHGNLDNRTVDPNSFSELAEFASWSIEDNITGWNAYLGEGHESKNDCPASAAAARVKDMAGLAPLYLDVPALDILRDEGINYASRVAEAGIPVELHVYPGVPHGFELFTPEISMAKMVMQNRIRAIKSV